MIMNKQVEWRGGWRKMRLAFVIKTREAVLPRQTMNKGRMNSIAPNLLLCASWRRPTKRFTALIHSNNKQLKGVWQNVILMMSKKQM